MSDRVPRSAAVVFATSVLSAARPVRPATAQEIAEALHAAVADRE